MSWFKSRWIAVLVLAMICIAPIAQAELSDEEAIACLKQSSKAFARVAEMAVPAVVAVQVERVVASGRGHLSPFDDEFFERFFGRRFGGTPQPRQRQQGQGSGFIITADGYILTNNHVVKDADKIKILMNDGREFDAEVIGTDPKTDVALIKVDGEDLPTIELGDSDELGIGEWVIAVGNPFGLTETVTVGVVSAKGRSGMGITGDGGYEDFIQTDAAINPGNSGGPLLNVEGKAIGINTAIVSQSGGYMGIGFAIPINMAKAIKDQLVDTGKVTRGYLGIYMDNINEGIAEFFDLDQASGVIVTKVAEDSPAEKAGLKKDDIILEVDGDPVKDLLALRNKIAFLIPGTEVELLIQRDGKPKRIKVEIGTRTDEEFASAASGDAEKFGLQVQELEDDIAERMGYEPDSGVLISEVIPGSSAARKGLRPGMLIMSVNRKEVTSIKEFQDEIKDAADVGKVLLFVTNGRGSQYVVLYTE